jgi:hypothetical protein
MIHLNIKVGVIIARRHGQARTNRAAERRLLDRLARLPKREQRPILTGQVVSSPSGGSPMFRAMIATTACVVLVLSGALAYAGGNELLNKKDSLKDGDKGYKPGKGTDKIDVPFADKIFQVITDNPHKVYKLKLKKGDKVVIEMKSDDMDSVVVVEDSKNMVLGLNDDDPDGGGTLNSRLAWTAPKDDEFRIIATCLDKKLGDFQILVTKAK